MVRNFAALGVLDAVADPDPSCRAACAEQYPAARLSETADSLFDDQTLSAVAIAAPAAAHGALARRALEAGKHVFVEKPLCLDVAEGRGLRALAEQQGRTLMVGHLLRYHPAYRALAKQVADGRIGNLRYIYATRCSLGRLRREENALWSFAPHDISMILGLTGALPEQVVANGGHWITDQVADTTLSHLMFAGNVQAHIFVSWLHPYKDHRMVVVGSDGMIVFDDVRAGADKLLCYPHGVALENGMPTVTKAHAEPIAYKADEPLAVECRHFIDCAANGTRPLTDADEALRVLAVLDACQRSMAAGTRIAPEAVG